MTALLSRPAMFAPDLLPTGFDPASTGADQSFHATGADSSRRKALRLVCSEIWGGNRPILTPVELPGIRGTLFSRPCDGGSGGDVHYLSVCGSGLLSRMCLADVVGHGQTVSAVSAEMLRQLRRCMNVHDQRRVLRILNRGLEQLGLKAMTTAALATYYPPARSLMLSYAGHPPGWVYDAAKRRWSRAALAEDGDPPEGIADLALAITPDVTYSRKTIRMAEGDRLLLVTDGVLEAPGADGLFGDERVEAILHEHRDESCDRIGEAIVEALCAHTGDAALAHDDVSFLVVEFGAGPKSPALWLAVKNRITRPRGNAAAI